MTRPHHPSRDRDPRRRSTAAGMGPRSRSRRRGPYWDRIALLTILTVAVLAGAVYGVLAVVNVISGPPVPLTSGARQVATATADATPVPSLSVSASVPATPPVVKTGPAGQLVSFVKMFKCVPAPKGVAITPDKREVWVTALVTRPSIGIYDPRTGRSLGSIGLGKYGAVEVVFNRDGTKAYASQMQSHTVYEIDTARRRVLRSFNTGSPWTKIVLISPDGTKLYAANWSGDDVSEISLASGKLLRRIRTVDTPRGLYMPPDGKTLYVAGFGEQTGKGYIELIDLATGKGRIIGTGRAMRHMVADESTKRLFTSDLGANCVWVTDLTTNRTSRFAWTDNKPNTIALSPDGAVLFVSCRGRNNPKSYNLAGPEWGSVLLLDTATGQPLDAIVGGNQCTALDVSRDGRLLVFSDFLDGRLRAYDVPDTATLKAGGGGWYEGHLRRVRKDHKLFVRQAPTPSGD